MVRLGSRMSMGDSAVRRRGGRFRVEGGRRMVLVIAVATVTAAAFWPGRAGGSRGAEGAEPAATRTANLTRAIRMRGGLAAAP